MKRLRFYVLLLGLALTSCQIAEKQSPPTTQTTLNVMSFNIRYGTANDGDNHWKKRKELVFDIFRNHHPDVAGVQEVLHFQLKQLDAALPEFGRIGVGRDDGKTKGEYAVILYRKNRFEIKSSGEFWLSDTPQIPGSKNWGNTIPRICTWARLLDKPNQQHFYFYNTHWDHQSQPSRIKAARQLARHIKNRRHQDPVIVTGDFNAGETNPAILYLKGQTPDITPEPLTDSYRQIKPIINHDGTFNGFTGKRNGEKIDAILISPNIQTIKANILHDNTNNRYPSDHFPITATLSLK